MQVGKIETWYLGVFVSAILNFQIWIYKIRNQRPQRPANTAFILNEFCIVVVAILTKILRVPIAFFFGAKFEHAIKNGVIISEKTVTSFH